MSYWLRNKLLHAAFGMTVMMALAGCETQPGKAFIGKAKSLFGGTTPAAEVKAPDNASAPTTVSQGEKKTEQTIAAGSKARVPVKVNGQTLLMEFEFPEIHTVRLERITEASVAAPRAPDQTVALQKLENDERRPLLYASIVAALAAVVALYLRYPGPAALCGIASAGFFAAWKIADLPAWFYAVGVAAVAIAVGLYLGHEKAEAAAKETASP